MKTLAIKYRPSSFDDVVEQDEIKTILINQLSTHSTKNSYLFCGSAGTGKTTCARIFADELNQHQGNPIEIDAASNSGVDNVRELIKQAQTKSIDSEYKIFIIDECHSLSNTAWQAFLKLIEEPPAKTVFIFCTTDPQKIPNTILSRVQRYDFRRISNKAIRQRLLHIITEENCTTTTNKEQYQALLEAVDYIAKLADGGLRNAITMLDKCLSYSTELTTELVARVLGTADYGTMFVLTNSILTVDIPKIVEIIETLHSDGRDLKLFVKQYMEFVLDLEIYYHTHSYAYIKIPETYEITNKSVSHLLHTVTYLNEKLRYETGVKQLIEATLLLEATESEDKIV